VSAVSVVPVASKNTKNGEIPVSRTALALSVRGPLVPVQDNAVGVLSGALAATVADWAALPRPAPKKITNAAMRENTIRCECIRSPQILFDEQLRSGDENKRRAVELLPVAID
jgi:hypothetical protein